MQRDRLIDYGIVTIIAFAVYGNYRSFLTTTIVMAIFLTTAISLAYINTKLQRGD